MIDERNFKPLRGLVLIRRDPCDTEKGGIIIPEAVQERGWRATVLRSGPKAKQYIKGDIILFLKEHTVLPFKDRDLALTDAKHILAKLKVVSFSEVIVPQNKFVLIEPHSTPHWSGVIFLPDKSKVPSQSGFIMRHGPGCCEVKNHCTAWFPNGVGVNCVEDGIGYKLIDESDIMAMQNGD